jgi:hypothetical protein
MSHNARESTTANCWNRPTPRVQSTPQARAAWPLKILTVVYIRGFKMLEIAKLLVSFLSGGMAGAFVTEWFRRRRGRVQSIPLIERVNRLVNPALEGVTLARRSSADSPLEELKNLREYQLTMRNDSSIHLKDAEVQFDFPAEDVSGVASRPTLSNTPLESVNAIATPPWGKAFKWTIPHLPAGDSVEFTFRAVDPSSEKYEAALYGSVGVVLQKVVGEPPPKKTYTLPIALSSLLFGFLAVLFWALATGRIQSGSGERVTAIKLAGCDLRVVSFYDPYGTRTNSPVRIKHRIFDVGAKDCLIQSEAMNLTTPVTIKPGDVFERERISESLPQLVDIEISVGATSTSLTKTTVPLFVER